MKNILKIIVKNKSTILLLVIFAISFIIKIAPICQGYIVPYGYVDTSAHISSALDLSEGNFKSLIHPWWHLKNHYILRGYDIVDRNSSAFFYSPFIHIILAIGFLFLHPGIASIIIISLFYSLSTISVFLLCKSFKFKDNSALVSAAIIVVSVPLIYSQIYGFWTFIIASNFLLLSYGFLRKKRLGISLFFCFLAVLTHWAFLSVILLIGLLELAISKNKKAAAYMVWSFLIALPFYTYLFYLQSPFVYVATHFTVFVHESYFLIIIAVVGLIVNFRKYNIIKISLCLTLCASLVYYIAHITPIFGDMVQFTYPFFIAFFIGSLFEMDNKTFKTITGILIVMILIMNIVSIQHLFSSAKHSISNQEFNELLNLRKEFKPDSNAILAIDRGLIPWWITIVSKDSKIVYPETYELEDMDTYYKNYVLKETNLTEENTFYLITKKEGVLVIEKNVKLPKELYKFG